MKQDAKAKIQRPLKDSYLKQLDLFLAYTDSSSAFYKVLLTLKELIKNHGNEYDINSKQFRGLLEERFKCIVSADYLRIIIHRLYDIGILERTTGDNRGNRVVKFNVLFAIGGRINNSLGKLYRKLSAKNADSIKKSGVTRLLKLLRANYKKGIPHPFKSRKSKSKDSDESFNSLNKEIKRVRYNNFIEEKKKQYDLMTYKHIDCITGEVKIVTPDDRLPKSGKKRIKRKTSSRLFQSHDFTVSYQKLIPKV